MKNKFLTIIAIIALVGFSITACDPGGNGNGDPNGPSLGDTITSAKTGMVLIWIPAGEFDMGSSDITGATPHKVILTQGFYMGKTQVTQEQWRSVMGTDARLAQVNTGTDLGRGDNYPMYWVNWYDAILFCNRLSLEDNLTPAYHVEGVSDWATETAPTSSNDDWNNVVIVSGSTGYRLPTEAQWEYACRAGTTTTWSHSESLHNNYMWFNGNADDTTHPVETKLANPWGLFDMHGNVWEWCWDRGGTFTSAAQTDPHGPNVGTVRVCRGGSWSGSAQNARSANRESVSPNLSTNNRGFRVVRP